MSVRVVSIHARAWRATRVDDEVESADGFNSRPRVAGDRRLRATSPPACCFNSRPRVAGDVLRHHVRVAERGVSIHARAWRATLRAVGIDEGVGVSIHARAWRATSRRSPRLPPRCFNSRPRVAGDGTTSGLGVEAPSFQFTPARGGRPLAGMTYQQGNTFQFTPARGGRPRTPAATPPGSRFNSRPRVAGDSSWLVPTMWFAAFQFTPARGGRPR